MLKRIISIFKSIEEENNTYSTEFLDFYRWCIEEFPRTLKERLTEKSLHPLVPGQDSTGKMNSYTVNFKASDLLWWEGIIEAKQPFFKAPEVFRREVLVAALDLLDDLSLPDDRYKEYVKTLTGKLP